MKSFKYIVKPDPAFIKTTFHATKREAWSQVLANVSRFGAHMVTVKAVNAHNKLDVVFIDTVGR